MINKSVFGNVIKNEGVDKIKNHIEARERFLFTGREFVKELGVYDYRNRIYSASLGKFLQRDPILFDGGDVNLYRYVGNNRVNELDSFGLVSNWKCKQDCIKDCKSRGKSYHKYKLYPS